MLTTSVAQTRKVSLTDTTPRIGQDRARAVARRQLTRVSGIQAPRLVVWQGRTYHLAWGTRVSGRDHGHPSLKSVYVDAHTGRLLGSDEHVAEGTGSSAYAGTVSIPTSFGASFTRRRTSVRGRLVKTARSV